MLRISYTEHKTNEYVQNMTATRVGHKSPYWRPPNDESWLDFNSSPGMTLNAKLFSRAR
ncbi:hypothetical protein DPMN_039054 [Dreissena polymorpha]|uniref:Uncharacterized protein n=1 Tax=Dreissena polymorpha TaxID=45954 RepID=A0A9D4RRC2_DREPO|nr:hypothetical protein DPMN_039054 [Dreissena polymorpha]